MKSGEGSRPRPGTCQLSTAGTYLRIYRPVKLYIYRLGKLGFIYVFGCDMPLSSIHTTRSDTWYNTCAWTMPCTSHIKFFLTLSWTLSRKRHLKFSQDFAQRQEQVPGQGRVPCWQKFRRDFFFRAGNVFFGLKEKRSLIILHGPSVTESYKIRNFIIS